MRPDRYLKFAITADIHFERLRKSKLNDYVRYFRELFDNERPSVFIIAGDTSDSKLMQAESDNYVNLVKFIKVLNNMCLERGIEFIILKGTPSHDGDVVKNILKLQNLDNIKFFNENFTNIILSGYNFTFIPEVTYPTYLDFENDCKEAMKETDVVIFHDMFDFAIPALKQIDSEFNLGRSVVINSKTFRKFFKILSIGGHVHSHIGERDIYYTGQFTNKLGVPGVSSDYGVKVVTLIDDKYNIKNYDNKYIEKTDLCELNFENQIDVILNVAKNYDVETTLFKVYGVANDDFAKKMEGFKKIIKPKFIKKVLRDTENDIIDDGLIKLGARISTNEQLIDLFKEMYKDVYKEDVKEELLKMLIKSKGDDEEWSESEI